MDEAVMADAASGAMIEIGKRARACKLMKRHIEYLFCYRQKVDELNDKISKELAPMTKADIQEKVEEAERKGDRVRNEAKQWLDDLEKLQGINKENVDGAAAAPCFCWGYRFAKRAARGLVDADSLKSQAAGFVTEGVSLPPTDDFWAFGTTESCMERVMMELCEDAVGLIGVHGVGGVGKSCLMKKVLLSAEENGLFKELVFAVVSHDVNLKRTQQHIAEQLGLYEKDSASIRKRLTKLNSEGGVLIVVDDLWEEELDLSLLGIPTCSGSCKVVITTRDRRVCTGMGCDKIIELTTLSEDESWVLFSKTAGVDDDDDSAVIELARAAVKKCEGLPLALTVLGKTMRGSNCRVEDWASAVEELEQLTPINMKGVPERLYRIVKLSFDRLLSEEERLSFLFLCLFPEDYSVSLNNNNPDRGSRSFEILLPTYTWYAVGEGFLDDKDVHTLADAQKRVGKILVRLKDCGLLIDGDIKDEDGEECESVKMHDVVRYVALQIAAAASSSCSGHDDPNGGYSLYSKAGDDLHLPNDMDCPRLRTLTLADNRIPSDIPDGFFIEMKALRVVDLSTASFSSFPTSLSCLTNLRVLFLKGHYGGYEYNVTDLLLISSLTNLEILSIRRVGNSLLFPTEMGNLSRLRYLDLRGCIGLMMPPNVLSKLSKLEQLYMTDSFKQWQVQRDTGTTSTTSSSTSAPPGPNRAAFVELAQLRRLTHLFVEVENKECLWQEFDSDDPWPILTEFSINATRDSTTAALWLEGGNALLSDRLKGRLRRGKPARVYYNALWPGWLKRLMTRTKQLGLYDWGTLDIPTSNFSHVEILAIVVTSIPSTLFNAGESFPNLKLLNVVRCYSITSIFASDSTLLPKVEIIFLKDLPQLTRICQEGDLRCPNLTRLNFDECDRLINIFCQQPDGVLCPNLRELTVRKCNSLTHIFSSVRQCQCLKVLFVVDCNALTAIIIETSVEELKEEEEEEATMLQQQDNSFLPRLEKLTLIRLPLLTKFHQVDSTPPVFIPSMQELFVEFCPQMEALHLGPESLTYICLKNSSNICISLSSSDFFSRAPLLEELELVGIKELFEIFGMGVHAPPMLPALAKMKLDSLPQLISICAGGDIPYGSFQNLIHLEIINCNAMSIFLSKRQAAQCLPQLKVLKIEECDALKELIMFEEEEEEDNEKAAGISMLPQLEKIEITGCPNLEKALVPELLPSLENLQSISINDCQKLWLVLDRNSRFQGQNPLLPLLRCIKLWDLPQLTSIWYGDIPNGSLPSLDEVVILRCDQLSNLFTWRQARCLQQLKTLRLTGCRALKDVIMPMHVDEEEITDENKRLFPRLEEIMITSCPNLEKALVPELVPFLENLLSIHVSDCQKLRRVLDCSSRFQGQNPLLPLLRSIELKDLPQLTSIWYGDVPNGSLPSLEEVNIVRCDQLSNLFTWRQARWLQQLVTLRLEGCSGLKDVIMPMHVDEEEITDENKNLLPQREESTLFDVTLSDTRSILLPALKDMEVDGCPLLKNMGFLGCNCLTHILGCQRDGVFCPNLTKLTVKKCNSLTHIFPSVRQFQCLENLFVLDCGALTAIIATSKELEEAEEATMLQQQDNNFLPRLQKLTLRRLPLLTKFHQVDCTPPVFIPTLHELLVEDCPQLEALHLGPDCLTNIRIENSSNLCNSLSSSDFFSRAPLLEELNLEGIQELYEIVFGMGVHGPPPMLTALTKMWLDSLPQLISICAGDIPYGSFQNLRKLGIFNCNSMSFFLSKSQAAQCLPQLKNLNIKNCAVLKELIMFEEEEEEEDDEKAAGISMLPRLEEILITGCPNLEKVLVPELLPYLENLRSIKIRECEKLRQVLDCNSRFLGQNPLLPLLHYIKLNNLPQLTSIWYGDVPNGSLPSLEEVSIGNCDQLSNLFTWRQARCLPQLKVLSIERCAALKELIMFEEEEEEDNEKAAGIIMLPRLEKLEITGCPNLEKALVPKLLPSLENLQSIGIRDCLKLREVLDCNSRFQGQNPLLPLLRSIELRDLPQLTSIWYGDVPNGSLPSLQEVRISSCDQLSNLFTWRQARCLPQLKVLSIERCAALKELIMFEEEEEEDNEKAAGIIMLPWLEKLEITGCPNLEKALVPELLPSLENLQSIEIRDCQKLREVLDCNSRFQGQTPLLPLLRSIELEDMPQLTSIWYGDVPNGSLPSLEEVDITECDQLSNLFTWRQARCLQRLETLWLTGCSLLKDVIMPMQVDEEEITDEKAVLPQLKLLFIKGCPNLEKALVPELLPSLENLQSIYINDCEKLREVLDCNSRWFQGQNPLLPLLRSIELKNLPQLTSIWYGDVPNGSLPSLEEVIIDSCDQLSNLFTWRQARCLTKLKTLRLTECRALKDVIMPMHVDEEEITDENKSLLFQREESTLSSDVPLSNSCIRADKPSVLLPALENFKVNKCPLLKTSPLWPENLVRCLSRSSTDEDIDDNDEIETQEGSPSQ